MERRAGWARTHLGGVVSFRPVLKVSTQAPPPDPRQWGPRIERFARRLRESRTRERGEHRPGIVVGAHAATALWVGEIAELAQAWPEDELRARICDHCPDRDACDWDDLGCDRQVNVSRFLQGKALPVYREPSQEL